MKIILFKFDQTLYTIQVKLDIATILDWLTKWDPIQIFITNYGQTIMNFCNFLY